MTVIYDMLNRKFILIVLLLLSGTAAWCSPRIALIGSGTGGEILAALTLAQGGETCHFVERGEVDTILREQRLTATEMTGRSLIRIASLLRAELFLVLTGEAGEMIRMTVFETANGFRLSNRLLPPNEATPENVLAEIGRCVEILTKPKASIFLSVTGIRIHNNTVDRQAKQMAEEVLRRLPQMENVVFLEREHLELLLRENRFTGQLGQLAAATQSIALIAEFGKTTEQSKCILQLRSGSGEITFETEASGSDPDRTQKIITALSRHLALTPPPPETPESRRNEGNRFLAEARWLKRYANSDPIPILDNYLIAIRLNARGLDEDEAFGIISTAGCDAKTPIPRVFQLLELLNGGRGKSVVHTEIWRPYSMIKILKAMYGRRNELSPAQLEEIREYAHQIRTSHDIKVDYHRKKELSERADTMHVVEFNTLSLLQYHYWFDDERLISEGGKRLRELMAELQLLQRHPAANLNYSISEYIFCLSDWFSLQSEEVAAKNAEWLADELGVLSSEKYRHQAEHFRFFAALLKCRGDMTAARSCIQQEIRRTKNSDTLSMVIGAMDVQHPDSQDWNSLYWALQSEYKKEHPSLSLTEQLEIQARHLREHKRDERAMYRNHPAQTLVNKPQTPLTTEFMEKINPGFRIRRVFPSTEAETYSILHSTLAEDGAVYLLCYVPDANFCNAALFKFDPISGKTEKLARIRPKDPRNTSWSQHSVNAFSIEGDHAVINNTTRTFLQPLTDAPAVEINWPVSVHDVRLHGGRVWAVNRDSLFSASLSGTEQTVHFSTRRDNDPVLTLAGVSGKKFNLTNLFSEPEADNLLLLSNDTLWRFEPRENRLSPLCRVPQEMMGRKIGDKIQLSQFGKDAGIMPLFLARWDQKQHRLRVLISTESIQRRDNTLPKGELEMPNSVCGSGYFIETGGNLWSTGNIHTPGAFFYRDAPQESPIFLFPSVEEIFPDPDGKSVLMVKSPFIFRVTPPERK